MCTVKMSIQVDNWNNENRFKEHGRKCGPCISETGKRRLNSKEKYILVIVCAIKLISLCLTS